LSAAASGSYVLKLVVKILVIAWTFTKIGFNSFKVRKTKYGRRAYSYSKIDQYGD